MREGTTLSDAAPAWMSWRLVPRLAWRYLVRPPRRGGAGAYLGGAALGIGLSLVPLIVVLEVSDGLIAGITRRFLEVGSYHLQVGLPPGLEADAALRRLLLDDLAMRLELGVGAVTSAGRERQGVALAAAGARRHVVTVRSLAEDLYRRDAGLRHYLRVVAGGFDLQGRGVVVSREVARQLDLRVGDRLALVTALDRGTTRGGAVLVPKLTPLEVRAIVATGYQELDRLWVFVSHATGDRLLPPGSGRDFVGVKVHDPFADMRPVLEAAAAVAGPGYTLHTWSSVGARQLRVVRHQPRAAAADHGADRGGGRRQRGLGNGYRGAGAAPGGGVSQEPGTAAGGGLLVAHRQRPAGRCPRRRDRHRRRSGGGPQHQRDRGRSGGDRHRGCATRRRCC